MTKHKTFPHAAIIRNNGVIAKPSLTHKIRQLHHVLADASSRATNAEEETLSETQVAEIHKDHDLRASLGPAPAGSVRSVLEVFEAFPEGADVLLHRVPAAGGGGLLGGHRVLGEGRRDWRSFSGMSE